jgi:hypothetical protein
MSRWIDADVLKNKLQQHHDFFVNAWGGFMGMPIKDKARCDELSNSIAEIINAPSIDLVRCGECKHCEEYESMEGMEYYCDRTWCSPYDWADRPCFYVKPNDFCSYGCRKESE